MSEFSFKHTTSLFVCVECGRPVDLLFRQYTRGIRLGRCGFCSSVADKYIECEFVLIAIDLLLHRIQAYRHLLFNRKPFSTHTFRGRLWQLGLAMAALNAHLHYTALFSEASVVDPSQLPHPGATCANSLGASEGATLGKMMWEAGGLVLAAVIEHACFSAGVIACARTSAAERPRRNIAESGVDRYSDKRGREVIVPTGDGGDKQGKCEVSMVRSTEPKMPPMPPASPTKIYMAIVYPLFFRLLAAFVMIWDRQVAILNTIELLVTTMQFIALSAVLEHPMTTDTTSGRRSGSSSAAMAVAIGMIGKVFARGVLVGYLGSDTRTLMML